MSPAAVPPASGRPSGPARPTAHGRRTAARLAAVQALYAIEVSGSTAERVMSEFAARQWPDGEDAAPAPVAPKPVPRGGRRPVGRVKPSEPEATTEAEATVEAVSATDEGYLRALVQDVTALRGQLDAAIDAALERDWTTEKLEVLLRAILRAGACELLARRDVPPRVVITEYLEIAHAFYAGREPGLVNAVLDRIAATARSAPRPPVDAGNA